MEHYVVVFLFTENLEQVWMINKQRPGWQKDKWNGIGGKVNDGETHLEAAYRELGEEAGFFLTPEEKLSREGIRLIGCIKSEGKYNISVYSGKTSKNLKTMTDEKIALIGTRHAINNEYNAFIENVPEFIRFALKQFRGDTDANKLILEY